MFKKAVREHDASAARQAKPLEQLLFPSSSPAERPSQASRSAKNSHPAGSNDVLRTSAQSTLNAPFKPIKPTGPAASGIKRTHAGLAKALSIHGSFEEHRAPNSQHDPIVLDENSPVKCSAPKATTCEYFDEADFDSDVDLDVEDPSMKESVAYPDLSATTNSIFYPTLPLQQQQSPALRALDAPDQILPPQRLPNKSPLNDSGYGASPKMPTLDKLPQQQAQAHAQVQAQQQLNSSAPMPWSSSPPEHHQTPPKAASLQRFAYNGAAPTRPAASVAQAAPAVKRRTLPWAQKDSQIAQAEQNGPPHPSHANMSAKRSKAGGDAPEYTPLPKDSKTSTHPWNTSASKMKEQQKAVREINKKKSKTNDPSEETSIAVKKQKSRDSVARVFLSTEQQHILDLVAENKKSVFFTGSAGTGKSVLLREIIATLRKKHLREPDRVAVTASTGLAACNIGGVTLHSFAGIGLGKEEVPELVKRIKRNQKAKHRWMRTKILVMDEVSMVDGDLFDKLEAIARQIRGNGRPFGGMQLVITGDFFQLPPVPDYGKIAKFAFDAASWSTSIEHTIGLHQVFRQKDPVFAGMLNEMREGRLTQASIAQFQRLSRPLGNQSSLVATELFPTRNEVEAANKTRMDGLVGEVKTFEARDGGTIVEKPARDRLLANCMAPEFIHLKKGAQVMLIKNIDETLVNGSLGKIIGFMSEQTFDKYHDNEEEFLATQGGTLDDEDAAGPQHVDKKSMAKGRLMDNLLGSTTQTWPVVRFVIADGTTRDLLCQRETWKVELPNGEVQASRAQIPLILAWALSIHKAQGQTLEKVKVDLGKVFEKGQAYVALSRATSMAGLQVLRFDPKKVNAHEKVRTFYQNLSRVEALDQGKGKETAKRRKAGVSAEEYERDYLGE